MAKLIYGRMSLDGYTEDERSKFGWGAPDDESVHSYVNQLGASVGTTSPSSFTTGRGSGRRWITV